MVEKHVKVPVFFKEWMQASCKCHVLGKGHATHLITEDLDSNVT